jgi:hypothetical protein
VLEVVCVAGEGELGDGGSEAPDGVRVAEGAIEDRGVERVLDELENGGLGAGEVELEEGGQFDVVGEGGVGEDEPLPSA